jgi:aspartate 1-decarboxylase
MIRVVRAKLHGIHVTDANLNYQGSITLDPLYCEKVGIYPLEFVEIWNKNNGSRISTYVIYGQPGSKCCVLNGAAARSCAVGDVVVIAASSYCMPTELATLKPKILTFHPDNSINECMEYHVSKPDDAWYEFAIVKE